MTETKGRKPTVVVVAGPNGSGKTSLLDALAANDRILGERINPDTIAEQQFGGWNDPPSIRAAADHAAALRHKAVSERRDFTFETVLSAPDKLDFCDTCKRAGYFVRAYFIATDSPEVNIARVALRRTLGGHDVPEDKIVSRYYRSLANAERLAAIAHMMQVFDNTGQSWVHALTVVEGQVYKTRLSRLPRWVSTLAATLPTAAETPYAVPRPSGIR